jgi:nitrogen fixation protein NifB
MQKSGQAPATLSKGGCGLHGLHAANPGGRSSKPLPEAVRRQIEDHPCFSEQAHHYFARMHLAVAPACNIQCNYCNRKYDCANESRPGVVSEVLTPEQAVKKVVAVVAKIPQLSVIGIAGPGDPLANPERTFATFRALAEKMPDLKLCVSTNGLMLPRHADELLKHNIGHVTITINCLDPDIGARIYPWIFWNHRRVRGRKAAEILIEQQQKGLDMLIRGGALVKINSVMIPGVNDEHLKEVSRVVRAKGAFMHNIIPLIADKQYGSYYSLTEQRAPGIQELQALRNACGGGAMRMMSHCQQCRSDAVGLLGQDRHAEFSMAHIDTLEIDEAAALRKRAVVQTTLRRQLEQKRQ